MEPAWAERTRSTVRLRGPDRTFVNSIGVDIEAYDLTIDSPAGTLRIDATSAEDGIRPAVLGLSVDLAE